MPARKTELRLTSRAGWSRPFLSITSLGQDTPVDGIHVMPTTQQDFGEENGCLGEGRVADSSIRRAKGDRMTAATIHQRPTPLPPEPPQAEREEARQTGSQ